MAGRLLLCLLLLCLATNYLECKRFSSSRSRGSSWGRGWGSSSASKPSHSSSSWFGSGTSAHKHPSSSSGLSGFGSSAPKYPSSSSGLSGFGSSAPKYPTSSSGLSGFGSSAPKYPSSSSGLSGFGSSAPKYPSSSSGLSGFGSSAPKYPSSSSGLSGFGSSAPKYPTSSSGLSGFGSSAFNYPSSSSGLSGSGSNVPKYPSSSSGLSGFESNAPKYQKPSYSGSGSSVPKYPSSTSGLSGLGSNVPKYPSSSTGLSGGGSNWHSSSSNGVYGFGTGSGNKHPPSTGYTGSGIQRPSHNYPTSSHTNANPSGPIHSSNTYHTNAGYRPPHHYGSGSYGGTHLFNTPSYYATPQHIYVNEYRNSGSRYGDLLTGLALYNLGRSHSHHTHHYYNDDYYRHRYNTNSYNKPKDEATCTLRINENNKIEVLRIPCEIVSTFTEGSKKVAPESFTQTMCTSNYTVVNNTLPATTILTSNETTAVLKPLPVVNTSAVALKPENISIAQNGSISNGNMTIMAKSTSFSNVTVSSTTEISKAALNVNSSAVSGVDASFTAPTLLANDTSGIKNNNYTILNPSVPHNNSIVNIITSNITTINSTKCSVTTDPLSVKGPPVNSSNMECEVDIVKKDSHIMRSKVDCKVLLQYAKMPEPKKENKILPTRSKLKSWLSNPPWWMSLLIAV